MTYLNAIECEINGGEGRGQRGGGVLNNRVGWTFSGYLISAGGRGFLIKWGDGKSKYYVFIVNDNKRI